MEPTASTIESINRISATFSELIPIMKRWLEAERAFGTQLAYSEWKWLGEIPEAAARRYQRLVDSGAYRFEAMEQVEREFELI